MIQLRRTNTHVTEDLLVSLSLRARTSGDMNNRGGLFQGFLQVHMGMGEFGCFARSFLAFLRG